MNMTDRTKYVALALGTLALVVGGLAVVTAAPQSSVGTEVSDGGHATMSAVSSDLPIVNCDPLKPNSCGPG